MAGHRRGPGPLRGRRGLTSQERGLVGWFGIRGVGSLYYSAVAIDAGVLAMDEASTIYWTILARVCVSVLVHGFTGYPAMKGLDKDG